MNNDKFSILNNNVEIMQQELKDNINIVMMRKKLKNEIVNHVQK